MEHENHVWQNGKGSGKYQKKEDICLNLDQTLTQKINSQSNLNFPAL